jgi:hypothetical protein
MYKFKAHSFITVFSVVLFLLFMTHEAKAQLQIDFGITGNNTAIYNITDNGVGDTNANLNEISFSGDGLHNALLTAGLPHDYSISGDIREVAGVYYRYYLLGLPKFSTNNTTSSGWFEITGNVGDVGLAPFPSISYAEYAGIDFNAQDLVTANFNVHARITGFDLPVLTVATENSVPPPNGSIWPGGPLVTADVFQIRNNWEVGPSSSLSDYPAS